MQDHLLLRLLLAALVASCPSHSCNHAV